MTPPAPHGSLHCDAAGFVQPVAEESIVDFARQLFCDGIGEMRKAAVTMRDFCGEGSPGYCDYSAKITAYDECLRLIEKKDASHTEKA